MGHAHGEVLEVELVAEVAQGAEAGADAVGVGSERGHGHEALDGDAREGAEGGDVLAAGVGGEALLGGLGGGVDLKEDGGGEVLGVAAGGDVGGELGGVDGVYESETADCFGDFVGLEVADEVPVDVGRELGDFIEGGGDAAFGEGAVAGVVGFEDGLGAGVFGDGDEGNVRGIAAAASGDGGDLGLEGVEAVRNHLAS